MQIANLVTSICLIKLDRSDNNKPNGICKSCLDIVHEAYNLRTLALFNDENFNFETDVFATIKKEVFDQNDDDDNSNFFDNDNGNIFVQTEFKTEGGGTDLGESEIDDYSYEQKPLKSKRGRKATKSSVTRDYSKRIRTCRWCTQQYKGYHTLRRHEATCHPIEYEQELEIKLARNMGCSFCFSRFYATKDMNFHIRTVHGIDCDLISYFCEHCSFSSNQKSKLETHIKTIHFGIAEKTYQCRYCAVTCVSQQNLRKHLANKHKLLDPNILYCDRCKFTSKVKAKISLHMQRVHLKSVDDFLCSSCDVVCQNKKERDLHHFAHSDIVEDLDQSKEILVCTICREQFCDRNELLNHLETHRNDVEFTTTPCVLCYKPVTGYQHLLDHTKEFHATKNRYKCRECGRCYAYGLKFLMHIQNHKNSGQTHLCPECGQSFRTVCLLNKHIRIDHRQILKCPHCPNKVYKSLVAFRFHVESHTNSCKYKCDLCPKSFSVYNRFKHHYAFHLNRTINQCSICQKCFEKPETLKTHLKRHNGTLPRNFPCGFCEKRFASRWAQENHERSHTKEKPYGCKYCSSQYSQKGDLVKHLAKVHIGENVYECDKCPESFRLLKDLKFHTMTIHALPT
jgi:KRAB domain-containing zinc finger protein